jgi:conjugative transfer region protein TrbK
MRALLIIASSSICLAGGACSPKPAASDPQQLSASDLKAQVDLCSRGGMDAANDPSCKHASDENFRRFLGKEPKR